MSTASEALTPGEIEEGLRNHHLRTTELCGHPAPGELLRFLRSETSPSESRAVVRHLLAGCPACTAVTREAWRTAEIQAAQALYDCAPCERDTIRRCGGRRTQSRCRY